MLSLHVRHQQIEIISICEEFTRLEIPSTPELQEYLLEIVDAVPATSNIGLYIDIVEEKANEVVNLINAFDFISKNFVVLSNIRNNT